MRKYSYSSVIRIGILFNQITGLLGLIISTSIALFFFGGTKTITSAQSSNLLEDPRVTLICVGIWSLVIGWVVSLGLINAFPTIWLGEEGVAISTFIFFRVFIPWSEIKDIHIGKVRFGNDLVRAKRITPFHRIYGWLYTHTLYPSFLILRQIDNHDALIAEFAKRIGRQ